MKFPDLDLAAAGQKIRQQHPGVAADVEHHERSALQVVITQGMIPRREVLRAGHELGDHLALQLREFWPAVFVGGALATGRVRLIADEVLIDIFHRVARQPEQGLISTE